MDRLAGSRPARPVHRRALRDLDLEQRFRFGEFRIYRCRYQTRRSARWRAMREEACSVGEAGLWHHWRAFPDSTAYVLAFAARVRGLPDPERLRLSFQGLVERHAALRS